MARLQASEQLGGHGPVAGGLGKEVLMHLLPVLGSLRRRSEAGHQPPLHQHTRFLSRGDAMGTELEADEEVIGLRVRVKLPQGCLEGNITHVEGPQVLVRGTLKCMEKGTKTRKSVTETVAWSDCKVVEDSLKWHDHEIPAEAVQRVEFQQDARNYSDCLEETVVEMMLKWGLYGHTADQGLMPCATRHWVASVWEYTFLLKAWDTVKDEDEPLLALLQLLSQPKQGDKRVRGTGPATKVKCLPVDPALCDHIFILIHLQRGRHWLLASIDEPDDCEMTQCVHSKSHESMARLQM
jgi:hypothetical protein